MIQGSEEWLEMRRNYIGASDVPVIMQVSPWKTPLQLWQEKLGLADSQRDSGPMMYGRKNEPLALQSFIDQTGIEMQPKVIFHPNMSYMMASLDGISEDGKQVLEIKCPGKKDHALASEGKVPSKYIPQLQAQMEVAGIDQIFYFSYSPESTYLIEVLRDQDYIDVMLFHLQKFWHCVQNFEEPREMYDQDIGLLGPFR